MEYRFSTREKNGSICLILSYKVNRKWRQKSRQGFKTKKEARAAQDDLLDAARKDAESGASPELAGITLRDFTEKIFLRDKKNSIEYGTAVLYRQSIDRVPSIADKPLHDITEGEVINAYNALAGKLEISTRNQTLAKVKTIFSYAVRTYHIRLDNPVLAVAIEKDKREKKIKAFTKEEADQLVESIENPTLRLAVLISLNTGMRFAEVAGLTWADIDFFKKPQRLPHTAPYSPAGCRTAGVEAEQSPLYRREDSSGARAEKALPKSGDFKIQARHAHAFPAPYLRDPPPF